jgi:DNA processing protein
LRWGGDTRAARMYKELLEASPGTVPFEDLLRRLEVQDEARAAARQEAEAAAHRALVRAAITGVQVIALGFTGYPDRLVHIVDPPIVLWADGDRTAVVAPMVALVGSRRATPAGLAAARRLAGDLARAGVVVVSGLAYGIDAAAHEGALDAGGRTVAVLGSGIDVVYPRLHEGLAERVRRSGCLVSELPPGAPPHPRHFPLRNRIISGLSLAVVVVEAAERSGSLITARLALEQGREVLAVPGPVVSGCHRGCHALIKDGAGLVETAGDVLAALGLTAPPVAADSNPRADLAGWMRAGEPVSLDELASRAGRTPAEALAELGVLEIDGVVARTGVGLFVRLD